mgnify:CR=1 FL=1
MKLTACSKEENESPGFRKKDCPWETSEIEHCPAFLEPEYAKYFSCPLMKECMDEIIEKVLEVEGLI